jgi:hypothetical protein
MPGFPSQGPAGADVGQEMAGVAEEAFADHDARLIGAVPTPDDVSEFPRRDHNAAADVEDPPGGTVVLQHEPVGSRHVADVDLVADCLPVVEQVPTLPTWLAMP